MSISIRTCYPETRDTDDFTIIASKTINIFSIHTPYKVAKDIGFAVLTEPPEHINQLLEYCMNNLMDTHPYYRVLFKRTLKREEIINFLKYFVAGACAFYNNHLSNNITNEFMGKIIEPFLLENFLGGADYLESYELCKLDSPENNNKRDITADHYFGDFILAYRYMENIFRGATADQQGYQHKLRAHMIFSYFIENYNQKEIDDCRNPYLPKDPSMPSVHYQLFSEYYTSIFYPMEDKVEEYESLLRAVKSEIEYIISGIDTKNYKVKRCPICNKFKVIGIGNNLDYCSNPCQDMGRYFSDKINECHDSFRKNVKSRNQNKFKLSLFLNWENIKQRIKEDFSLNKPELANKSLALYWYFELIVASLHTHIYNGDNYDFVDRPVLVSFLQGKRSLWEHHQSMQPSEPEYDLVKIFSCNAKPPKETTDTVKKAHKQIWINNFYYILYGLL